MIEKYNQDHAQPAFYTDSSWSWLSKIMLTVMCLLAIVSPTECIRIKDDFQYCEVHDNKAIWDLPESCTNNIKREEQNEGWFSVLDEQTNPVNGQGWECSIKKITYRTYTSFLLQKILEKYDEQIDISREDCMNTSKKMQH